jgi:2-amino-4-hydroxy-6-hydroxymethyldihydropteridine diphosphokinase/dihydropteroate synthase
MGRKKVIDKGPRNIDLDILLYGDRIVKHPRLLIPHISIAEREFVLRPLSELIPHQPLHPSQPWKLTADYLNALPRGEPISTVTPLSPNLPLLRALDPARQTHVMAILNTTPDSFSDGGVNGSLSSEGLNEKLTRFIQAGATIIDIGGQSTAPRTPEVPAAEETARVLPAIKAVLSHPLGKQVAISVDTYRSSVAAAALDAGAHIINDVSAGAMDPDMLKLVAERGATICLMHMRGTPATMTSLTDYPQGLLPTIARELEERIAAAESAGIRRWRIILDPGIGFAKTQDQNLEILRHMEILRDWPSLRGLPWLLGSSRKGFVGKITGVAEARERTWGTAATVTAAVQGGADIVRVHDVQEMSQVVRMSDAIYRV